MAAPLHRKEKKKKEKVYAVRRVWEASDRPRRPFAYTIAPDFKQLVYDQVEGTETLQRCMSLESMELRKRFKAYVLKCDWHSIMDSLGTGPKGLHL